MSVAVDEGISKDSTSNVPPSQIEPAEVLSDIRSGLDREELLTKYRITAEELQSLLRAMVVGGLISTTELAERLPLHQTQLEIRNRFSNKVIYSVVVAPYLGALVESAVSWGIDLSHADLVGVNLPRADLSGAQLSGADLTRAILVGADFTGAKLAGALLGLRGHARGDPLQDESCGSRSFRFEHDYGQRSLGILGRGRSFRSKPDQCQSHGRQFGGSQPIWHDSKRDRLYRGLSVGAGNGVGQGGG